MLAAAGSEANLPVITEVMDAHDLDLVCRYAQFLQIGARNMQNFTLLRAVGQTALPVLLKRGPGCRIRDLLMAAEYVLCEGNGRVVLCERGITTFEDAARNTTDINAVPILKELSHLPVFLDPSHSTGERRWVAPIAKAAIAAGADGLIVEVHPNPQVARSDGRQSLRPDQFTQMMGQVRAVAEAVGRTL
jgi:3-deoxy-7-phosphoheptulonate synthase